MSITVKYFAILREQTGKSQEIIEYEEGMTAADVWSRVRAGNTAPENLKVAVNMEYSRLNAVLADGDEVAFFPAVTGG